MTTIQNEAPWLLPVFAALFGLVWGSFLNVVIHRLPLGESIVSPRSRCPVCREMVSSFDNVPVLSYVLLGGKCRHCRTPISIRYPLVELAVGLSSVTAFLRHGLSLEFFVEFGFVAAVLALMLIDYDHQILPDRITLSGVVLGLALAPFRDTIGFVDALAGAALGAGILFLVAEVYFRVKGIEGMGFGDVKMMGMVGAFVGWKAVLLTLFIGSLTGSIVGVAILASRGGDMKTKLPFGTFLGVGAIVSALGGSALIGWYSGLF